MSQSPPTEQLRFEQAQALRAEAERLELESLGQTLEDYFEATPRQRGAMKARAHRVLKRRAVAIGADPVKFYEMSPATRRELEQRRSDSDSNSEEENEEDKARAPTSYSEGMDMPIDEARPEHRSGVSVGPIIELDRPPDLVGNDKPPLTFTDLYYRWPVGRPGGDDYYIRVERILPKTYQGIPCAGPIAEIRVPMTEMQFGKWFGGREYQLRLYGPTPHRLRDENGDLRIKALTDFIHVTVPSPIPILHPIIPKPSKEGASMMQHPYDPNQQQYPQPPLTNADASIHASSLRFAESMVKFNAEQVEQARKSRNSENGGDSKHLIGFVSEMSKSQLDATKEDARRREEFLLKQIEDYRTKNNDLERTLEETKMRIEQVGAARGGDSIEMLKFSDASNSRQSEYYRQQIDNLQRSHDEQLRRLQERQQDELTRERERYRDAEDDHRRSLENERKASAEREKTLKEEIERIRREEREAADRRVADAEKTAEQRYKDQEKAHERELRTIRENMETRAKSESERMSFELATIKDRLEEAKAEMIRVRDSSDPIKAIKKYKSDIQELGLQEKEEAPKSGWDLMLQAAGGGIGQFLSRTDPNILMGAMAGMGRMAMGTAAGQPRQRPAQQLPPAVGPQQRLQQPPGPRRRRDVWATQGSPVAAQGSPVAAQQASSQQPPPPTAPGPAQPPVPPPPTDFADRPTTPPQSAQSSPAPQPPPQAPPTPQPPPKIELPEGKFHQVFSEQEIVQFLDAMERAIDAGIPPLTFAQQFAQQYPQYAQKVAHDFKAIDAVEYVGTVPWAAPSPILRRDGKKWLEQMWESLHQLLSVQADPAVGQ